MNDVNEAFDAYWKTHFEKLVLPINFKKEMKKIAWHAYQEGFRHYEREYVSENSSTTEDSVTA
ncbi:MAG: hypothetical protein PUE30_01050 [Spirochaetia bacterium]|nr:hypothetical protein [Spirochaetia bacterium]